jgi:ribosomal protein S27AE
MYPTALLDEMARVKERCEWCDKSWEREDNSPRHACPRCGQVEWDQEPIYGNYVGAWNEYEIMTEATDPNLILWLDLRGTMARGMTARVPLGHRLKEVYRHGKGDLSSKDGRGLIIAFHSPSGSGAQWGIALKRPWPEPKNPFLHQG